MCLQYRLINPASKQGLHWTFAPCGNCQECRDMSRSAWEFRLRAEVEHYCIKENWQMCFFTLTYNEQNLPYLPPHVFKEYDEATCSSPNFKFVPCFNKQDIRDLIHGLRKYLNKKYGVKRLVYIICSEYGSNTRRPHYHGSILFPPCVPAEELYQCIRDLWCAEEVFIEQPKKLCGKTRIDDLSKRRRNKGFICPREFAGVGREKPFLVPTQNSSQTACYTAKYVSKDIYFMEQVPWNLLKPSKQKTKMETDENDPNVYDILPNIREYVPFHFQTRSLGSGILKGLGDDEKRDLLFNGFQFIGKDRPQAIPLYIKNKIIFDAYYVIGQDGRRLVRRKASEFFRENYEKVYCKKVGFYEEFLEKLSTPDYIRSCGVSDSEANEWSAQIKKIVDSFGSPLDLAKHYVLYFGVARTRCYIEDVSPAKVYLNRYLNVDTLGCRLNYKIPGLDYWQLIQDACGLVFGFVSWLNHKDKTEEERLIDEIADYHKSASADCFDHIGYFGEYEDAF